MSGLLRVDDIRRIMVTVRNDQTELKDEYIPEEARNGKGAPDDTEFAGFKRDFESEITAALQKFSEDQYYNGVSKAEFADYLTEQARMKGSNSAGPYLAATLREVRDVVAPDYVDPVPFSAPVSRFMQATSAVPVLAVDVIVQLRAKGDDYAQDVLNDVERNLPRAANDSMLKETLKGLVNVYGEDYMAEVASGLIGKVDRAAASISAAKPEAVSIVASAPKMPMPSTPAAR